MTNNNREQLVEVKNLQTHFFLDEGTVRAVDGADFVIHRGETLGVVGESGCGKSVTARSILNIVPKPGKTVGGEILYHRKRGGAAQTLDLTQMKPQSDEMRAIRGSEIAMVFQEPMTSLSPVHTIGNQIGEAIRLHQGLDQESARKLAIEMLDLVGMPLPDRTIDQYAHQLSGGMRQRAMIAMALSCHPSLLIADEPTTALDVTTEAQILDADAAVAERAGDGDHVHHAQPGGDRADGGERGGDVHGESGGAGGRGHDLLQPAAPVHPGVAAVDPAAGAEDGAAGGGAAAAGVDPGDGAGPVRAAARVSIPPAVQPDGGGAVRSTGTADDRSRAGASRALFGL